MFQGDINKEDDITDYILDTSTQEFCSNKTDVLLSKTAERILSIVIQQMNNEKEGDEQIKRDMIIDLYKRVFIENTPITRKEHGFLRDFFNKKDILPKINQLLSKTSIQQSDDNKIFIRRYLENHQTKKYDVSEALDTIQDTIGWNSCIVDIDLAEGEKIEQIKEVTGLGVIYSYKDIFGKFKLFFINNNKKVIYLEEEFEQKPETLENGLILGVEIRGKGNNGDWLNIDKSINEIELNGPYFSDIGILYRFNSETNKLEQVYCKEGLTSLEELDVTYGFFQTTNKSGKKGVMKIIKSDIKEWGISEILQELYDRIYMGPDGLMTTEGEDEEIQEDDSIIRNTIVGLHMEAWNDTIFPSKLTGKTLGGWFGNNPVPWIHDFSFKMIDFPDGDNMCRISTTKGYNYYTINKKQQTITPIDGLQGIKHPVDDNFLQGNIPSLIDTKSGKLFVKVFNKKTNTVQDLIEIQSKIYPSSTNDINRGNMIKLSFYPKETIYAYFHEGKLYDIKEGFEIKNECIYKTRFLRSAKDLEIPLDSDFDQVSEFLKEISTPIMLIL